MQRIDFNQNPLVVPANGKEYKLLKELTIARFKELDKLEVEFFYGFNMQELFDKLKEIYELINKGKLADTPVKVHNLMTGVADKVDKREPVMLRICSLFLVTDDEDIHKWSEESAREKIMDWTEEGYAMSDFFTLAASLLPDFLKTYEEVSQDISEEQEKQKSGKSKKK